MKKTFTYFETKPVGGKLDDVAYERASRTLGRVCLDVACITNRELVLAERNIEPAKGLWMSGGRIRWELFEDVYQYAAYTAKEHFGIEVPRKGMVFLSPRFVCFQKRPYPEVLIWVAFQLTERQYRVVTASQKEQNRFIVFQSRKDLQTHMRKLGITSVQSSALLDLWDELKDKDLID